MIKFDFYNGIYKKEKSSSFILVKYAPFLPGFDGKWNSFAQRNEISELFHFLTFTRTNDYQQWLWAQLYQY